MFLKSQSGIPGWGDDDDSPSLPLLPVFSFLLLLLLLLLLHHHHHHRSRYPGNKRVFFADDSFLCVSCGGGKKDGLRSPTFYFLRKKEREREMLQSRLDRYSSSSCYYGVHKKNYSKKRPWRTSFQKL